MTDQPSRAGEAADPGLTMNPDAAPYTLFISPRQMIAAAERIAGGPGGDGQIITGITSPFTDVTVFAGIRAGGGRFAVVTDQWGNCNLIRAAGTPGGDDEIVRAAREMTREPTPEQVAAVIGPPPPGPARPSAAGP